MSNARIDRWRRSLLDLTLRNRLLDARDGRQSIALTGDPAAVLATLADGAAIDLPGDREKELTAMARAAREAMEEGGAQVLHVALGLLAWKDDEGTLRHAPLALWPVALERGARWRAAPVDDEPRLNETLLEKLKSDLQIEVKIPESEDFDLGAVMGAFAAAIVGREGWQVIAAVRLGVFSFTKFVMWNDLGARGLETPLVAHLAEGTGAFATPALPDATGELYCPLDADATQLAAVRAAEAGRTFVLQGPPGTGKSQTIANLIAQCLSAGKTVLFVSEKMAALEVVQRRLAAVGLGDFCLELHSHRARKRAVLDELGKTLERAWRPVGGVTGDDAKLEAVRAALDDYVRALHTTGAIGVSVHDALARLSTLREAPRLEVPVPDGALAPRREALAAYAEAWTSIGENGWRDSDLAEWQLSTGDAVAAVLAELDGALTGLDAALAAIPALPRSAAGLAATEALAAIAAKTPKLDTEVVLTPAPEVALTAARERVPQTLAEWAALSRRRNHADAALEGWTLTSLEEADLAELAARFHKYKDRFALWRWLGLRKARARLRPLAPRPLPDDATVADTLDRARAARTLAGLLIEAAAPAKRWLGAVDGGDLAAVDAALTWARELRAGWETCHAPAPTWRAVVASLDAVTWAVVENAVSRWRLAIERLAQVCGVRAPEDDPIGFVRARLPAWRGSIAALRDWTAYVRARRGIAALGLGSVTAACEQGAVAPAALADAWEKGALLAWTDAQIAAEPALRAFHGSEHHARVGQFVELDRASLGIARARLIMKLAERVPRVSGSDPAIADDGEIGVLLRELKKQRRHWPLRRLFAHIPTLLGRLKPCVLMSPLSVAQYLDSAVPPFDLVVFDEASQIPTADAIGALARGTAAVIVGDSKQLPPTRFFEIERNGHEDEEYEELESILDECVAARLPELRLGWHYRSRHEDLIGFSNHHYYDDQLAVFPAAAARVPELGVAWRKVDGVYDRAGTRTNRKEAEAVVAEVLARMPRGRSIGVVTFSRAQQDLIEDLFDDARRADPAVEQAFTEGAEPVLVKNLETIQGDERDVILFSIGYGPDAAGKLTMNFGPLNQAGGERRLNVAVTRAREQLVVFSSFDAEAIADDAAPVGVKHLAELLAYVKEGGARSGEEAPVSGTAVAVAAMLRDKGWTVRTGVGCASYRVDLAVVDPDDAGRYILGIECDGAPYAAATVARDRDRLRAQVLAQLGWRLHRIWSLDWWLDPDKESQRAHNAVIAAIAAARAARKPKAVPVAVPAQPSSPTRAKPIAEQGKLFETRPIPAVATYRAATIPAGRRTPDDLHEPKFEPELGNLIDKVLEIEAPLHVELLARRVGAYFGIGRVTAKVTDRVREVATARARVADDIVWRGDQDPAALPPPRAADAGAESKREADEIPLVEVAAAAALVLGSGSGPRLGMPVDDLARETARLLGFARLGERVQRRMRAGIDALVARGACKLDGERASVPD